MSDARMIERDLFTDIPAGASGNSPIIDLMGSSGVVDRLSCQGIYDVQSPSAGTFDSGESEVDTFTFDTQANTSSGDYMVVYDTDGNAWAAAADLTGSDPEPTGAVWVSIPAARKTQVDLSGDSTADEVAASFAAALEALTAVPFASAASTDDVACTQDIRGPVTAPEVHNADDSGDGSITVAVTNAGVASEVDVDENTLTIPAHGFATGLVGQLTTTGTLPSGLSTGTDYYVIYVDDDTVKFASSLANALAGTAVDITTQGSDGAVNTFTPAALSGASLTFQGSNDGTNWTNLQTATSISADGSVLLEKANVAFRYFRAVKALTAGQVDLKGLLVAAGSAT